MSTPKFSVSPAAQRDYRVLGGVKPTGANKAASEALRVAKASRTPPAVHVTQRKDGWAVKTEGRDRAASVETTKAAALKVAKKAAASHGARVVEHGRDGLIQRNTKPRK